MLAADCPSDLARKYLAQTPRYTSYPPIPHWGPVQPGQVAEWLETAPVGPRDALSLYTHVPFCRAHCLYCGCFVIITPQQKPLDQYVETVQADMATLRRHLPVAAPVRQYHLGGGTPTLLERAALTALVTEAQRLFPFEPQAEMSIEVDPRTASVDLLAHLRALGFNRLSLGVQDLEPAVQARVRRDQPLALVQALTDAARRLGFLSLNYDLIYGLPLQTPDTFEHTLRQVLQLGPDRLALYNFAYLPALFAHQRQLDERELPDAEARLAIFTRARAMLGEAGYAAIGMDHFARESDDLALALRQGRLQRNFMGYTSHAGTDLLAFGISGISEYGGHYWQNVKRLSDYRARVAAGDLPAARGMSLSADDSLRRAVIHGLLCEGRLRFADLDARAEGDARATLGPELEALRPLAADGLVQVDAQGVRVTERGRLFLRHIAVVFDRYARKGAALPLAGAPPDVSGAPSTAL